MKIYVRISAWKKQFAYSKIWLKHLNNLNTMFQNNSQALQKFKRNYWGVCSLFFIVILSIISILAYAIAPDNSQNANNGDISLRTLLPGTSIQMIRIPTRQDKASWS